MIWGICQSHLLGKSRYTADDHESQRTNNVKNLSKIMNVKFFLSRLGCSFLGHVRPNIIKHHLNCWSVCCICCPNDSWRGYVPWNAAQQSGSDIESGFHCELDHCLHSFNRCDRRQYTGKCALWRAYKLCREYALIFAIFHHFTAELGAPADTYLQRLGIWDVAVYILCFHRNFLFIVCGAVHRLFHRGLYH